MTRLIQTFVLLLALAAGQARAQDFVLHTQNLLHFGQGSNTAAKCQELATIANTADIILVQELMTQAYPCPSLPANFRWQSYGPYGATSYREYYGYLWRTNATAFGTQVQALIGSEQYAPSGSFSRPPVAVPFRVTLNRPNQTFRDVWIVNFHAVWGRTVGGRRAEAQQMGNFYAALRNNTPVAVIVGGDWNLRAANARGVIDPGFSWLGAGSASIAPNDPTTLTARGTQSSAYDHFVFTSGIPGQSVSLTTIRYPAPGRWLYWRQNVSDHLGVAAQVTFQ